MAAHYELSRGEGGGWNATYYNESGTAVGEGHGMTARGARKRAASEARDRLSRELGKLRSRGRHRAIHPHDILQIATVGHGVTHRLGGWKDYLVIRSRENAAVAERFVRGADYPNHYRVVAPNGTVIMGPGAGSSRARPRYHSHPSRPWSHLATTKHRRSR